MKILLMLLTLCGASTSHAATVTNLVLTNIANTRVTRSINLEAGQSARVLAVSGPLGLNSELVEIVEGIRIPHLNPLIGLTAYGPQQLEFAIPIDFSVGGAAAMITLSLEGPAAPPAGLVITNIPSNAVVIPADSAGPVTILLESSVDLITWNAALPGHYATSTTNRFFRVRAVRP